MQDMIDFSVAMMDNLALFLRSEPIFYLFSLVCFCFVAKFIMILIGRRY